jgi:hypothetical protein
MDEITRLKTDLTDSRAALLDSEIRVDRLTRDRSRLSAELTAAEARTAGAVADAIAATEKTIAARVFLPIYLCLGTGCIRH